jgi:large repetitive protein
MNRFDQHIRINHKCLQGAFGQWVPQWASLLILALGRVRRRARGSGGLPGPLLPCRTVMRHIIQPLSSITEKNIVMQSHKLLIKWTLLLLFFSGTNLLAQNPYPNTGNHSVCLNATEPYGVVLNAGSTYIWTITPLAGGNGTITPGATPNLVTINWSSVGTATLQVVETNVQGCVGDPVTIIITIHPRPTLVITNPPAVCAPATVDLTATAVTAGSTAGLTLTYWTDAAGTIPYTTPTAATAGTYYIKGTSAAGCIDIQPVTVTVNPTPTLVINNPAAVCAPATVDITVAGITAGSTPGLTLTYWTDAAGTIPYTTPTAATNGTYYIKGTTAAGCTVIQPVTVVVTPTPTVVVTNPAPVCAPNMVNLTAAGITAGSTPGLTFTYWTDAAGTIPLANPTAVTAGTYYIKGALAGGCFDIQPVVVTVNPLPIPVITGPTPVCVSVSGSTSTYSTPNVAGNSYAWTITGGTITGGQGTNQITVSWTTAGAGSVGVTQTITATGCAATVSQAVTVNPKPVTTPISHN